MSISSHSSQKEHRAIDCIRRSPGTNATPFSAFSQEVGIGGTRHGLYTLESPVLKSYKRKMKRERISEYYPL